MIVHSNNVVAVSDILEKKQETAHEFLRCFSTLGCPDLSLEGIVSLAQKFKIDCLELRFLENRLDLPECLESFPGGCAGAHNFLLEKGLGVRVLGSSFRLVGHDLKMQDELQLFGELANAWGVPYIRVFGGGTWGQVLSYKDFQEAVDALVWWKKIKKAEGWNVELLMETHDAFSASYPCLQLQSHVGHSLNLLWDSHHTWRLGGESPSLTWRLLHPWIRHVHFKDSVNKPSEGHPYTYVTPGKGEMPLAEVFEVLRQGRYAGAVSLEWEKKWHPSLPPVCEALEACDEMGWWRA